MWTVVGFTIYTFEGIGILMPVMKVCECPEIYDKIVIAALTTLCAVYCLFGTLSYLCFGETDD
jgi:amino acid permease